MELSDVLVLDLLCLNSFPDCDLLLLQLCFLPEAGLLQVVCQPTLIDASPTWSLFGPGVQACHLDGGGSNCWLLPHLSSRMGRNLKSDDHTSSRASTKVVDPWTGNRWRRRWRRKSDLRQDAATPRVFTKTISKLRNVSTYKWFHCSVSLMKHPSYNLLTD